jgi:hypothetical protein
MGCALQGEELEPARQKAEAAGVKDIFIDDLREEFVKDYVFPMFRCARADAKGGALIYLRTCIKTCTLTLTDKRANANANTVPVVFTTCGVYPAGPTRSMRACTCWVPP